MKKIVAGYLQCGSNFGTESGSDAEGRATLEVKAYTRRCETQVVIFHGLTLPSTARQQAGHLLRRRGKPSPVEQSRPLGSYGRDAWPNTLLH